MPSRRVARLSWRGIALRRVARLWGPLLLAVALRGLAVLPLRRLPVLSLRGLSVALLRRRGTVLSRRRSTVALLRWSPILTWRRGPVTLLTVPLRAAVAWHRWRLSLLVFTIIGRIDSTHEKFDEPELRSKVNGWICTRHLNLLVLIIRGAVNQISDGGIGIQLAKEFPSLLIVSNLSELEVDRTRPIAGPRKSCRSLLDGLKNSILCFAGWLSIRNGDDKNRFLELIGIGFLDDISNDFVIQFGAWE